MDRKSTIIDIAERTGYSIATVSRALNNFSNVKDTTKKHILEVAREINYVPNFSAKNLVKGRSKRIGLVLPDESQLGPEFIHCLNYHLLENDYNLIYYRSDNENTKQNFHIEQLLMQQVDGIIFCPIPGNYDVIQRILSLRIPFLIVNRFVKDFKVNNIVFNFRTGLTVAINALVARGAREFVQLVRQDLYYGIERRNTLKFALNAHDIEYKNEKMLPVDDTYQSGYLQMKKIIEEKIEVDAVVCSSDVVAVGAARAVVDCGLKIPEDISVIGCYESEVSNHTIPRISTIRTDFENLSVVCVTKLLKMIDEFDDTIETISIDTTFVAKESS